MSVAMRTARQVLLLVKPLDVFPPRAAAAATSNSDSNSDDSNEYEDSRARDRFLDDRRRVHQATIRHCWALAKARFPRCHLLMRDRLTSTSIPPDLDLLITVGGDGTLLKASHFFTRLPASSVPPVLGVNSDPTDPLELHRMAPHFDATRSTGFLCAATPANFQQVLDDILSGLRLPTPLSRLSLQINAQPLPTFALNDILFAHPCPASVSRFSFRIRNECGQPSRLINCRSSGLRVCTAAGSTAAMQSAGGIPMHISMPDLQYMVREPISPPQLDLPFMHGFIKQHSTMLVSWYSQHGMLYFDGSHVYYKIKHGDQIQVASDGPILNVFLPHTLLA